jgi:hypothetical protein
MFGNSRKRASKLELIVGGAMMLTVGSLLSAVILVAERRVDISLLAFAGGGAIALFVLCGGLALLMQGLKHKQ